MYISVSTFLPFKHLDCSHNSEKGLPLFRMDRNIIFLYLLMHEKRQIKTGVCV